MNDEQMTTHIMELRESVAGLRQDLKAAFKRIDEQTQLTESVHELALSMCDITGEIKRLSAAQEAMRKDIDEIKARPTKRWDAAMAAVIAGLISVLIGFVFKG